MQNHYKNYTKQRQRATKRPQRDEKQLRGEEKWL